MPIGGSIPPAATMLSQLLIENIINDFKVNIHDRAREIDPNNDYCWYSLAVGWALEKGYTPKAAQDISQYIRYHTDLG